MQHTILTYLEWLLEQRGLYSAAMTAFCEGHRAIDVIDLVLTVEHDKHCQRVTTAFFFTVKGTSMPYQMLLKNLVLGDTSTNGFQVI